MFAAEIGKMLVTNSSTAKQEEKQEERGSCQTLAEIKKRNNMLKRKNVLFLIIMILTSSIYAKTSIVENYLKNKNAMIKLRETRRISLAHFGNIDFFFLTDSLNCRSIELENFDFKDMELKSKIPVNQLVTLIADYEGKQKVVMLEESDKLVAVDYNELIGKSVYFGFRNNNLTNLTDFSKEEILLSFFTNNPFNFGMMNYREKDIQYLTSYLEKQVKQSTAIEYYNISTSHLLENYHYNYTNHLIPANSIKNICSYQYKRIIENKKLKYLFALLKKIALDENIPIKSKTMYTNSLLYNYLEENKDDTSIKREYFDYVLKVVNESPNIKIGEFHTSSHSDINAMQSLFRNTQNNKITAEELFQISKQILEIDKNPIVSLQAYCGIQYYYLKKNDLKKALKTATESIKRYDNPILWRYYKEKDYFNAKPALMYIDYLMENGENPNEIIEIIDQFIKVSYSHPEFQNFLIYRKSIVKDFFSYPLEEVIFAYEQINTEPENFYVFNQPFSKRDYARTIWDVDRRILPALKQFIKYEIEIESEIKVKKNILLEKSETINLKINTKILIHQRTPYLLSKYGSNEYARWVKGEIEGQIYWILFE